jgi:hypothetical protein
VITTQSSNRSEIRTEVFPRQNPQPASPRALIVAADAFAVRPFTRYLEGGPFDVETALAGKGILAEIGRTRPQ